MNLLEDKNTCIQTQSFGGNANPFYSGEGLKGHPGTDIECGYGTPITAQFDGFVYKIFDKDNPTNDGTGYQAVCMIVETELELFEWQIGHCTPICKKGLIKATDIIGTEANHGEVYFGGIQITLAMQSAGDLRGSHRHYQKRPVIRSIKIEEGKQYLSAQDGSPYFDGSYYAVPNFSNGYNGCEDCTLPPIQTVLKPSVYQAMMSLLKQFFGYTPNNKT